MCFIERFGKFLTITKRYQHFSYICYMQLLKQLFNFYINSSIHVAFSVVSLTWITFLTVGFPASHTVLLFLFFATITGYNFVKYFGVAKFHHRRLTNWLKWIQLLSFICFLLMCYYALKLEVRTYVFLLALAVLTVFYAIPVFSKQKSNLRNVSGIKVYLIALVWAGVTVFVPIINADYSVNADVIILGVQRFLYVLILMLPFEIRDLKYDALNLSTIPQKLGVKKTKNLGVLLLVGFFVLEFLKKETHGNTILALLIITILTAIFVRLSKIDQNKYYCSFWVEGLPILWLLLVFLIN